jgi:hypothetical protein
LIDPTIADREWASNTDPSRLRIEERDLERVQRRVAAEAASAVDVRIPIDRLSLWVDDYHGGESIIVLAVGNVDHSREIDIDSSWCIPMNRETARLVGAKLLSLAHEAGEDISSLFAHPDRIKGVRQLMREARA